MSMQLLSPGDAARRLNISVSRLTQMSRENILPTIRDSAGRRFFDEKEVEKLAKVRAESPDPRLRARGRFSAAS